MVSHTDVQQAETATAKAVTLVDCDVHAQATEPMLAEYLSAPVRRRLERYGRRTAAGH